MDDEQLHVPVDTAVEGEVGLLGIDAVVDAVVHLDLQVVLLPEQGGDLGPEGGVAAVVMDDALTVELHIGGGVDALELQIDRLCIRVKGGQGKTLLVGTGPTPVVVAAVLTVHIVPGVRHVHRLHSAGGAEKRPFPIQADALSH